jgi:carbon storage regulator
MLVLSRERNQDIAIGDHIVVTVVGIRGNSVRLGITAPKETPITRPDMTHRFEGAKCGKDWTWAFIQVLDGERVCRKCNPDRVLSRSASGYLQETFYDHGERITQEARMNRNDAEACDWVVVHDE